MLTFIKWQFWIGIFTIVIKLGQIASSDRPRIVKFNLGEDIVGLFMGVFFAVWAWFLIYRP